MSQPSVTGRVIVIEQELGQEIADADWTRFSVDHQIVSVAGTSDNYSADHLVGIVFTPGEAQFYGEPGLEESVAALAMAFMSRFGGAMTIPPAMRGAIIAECRRW